jgi:hypothetical protein
VPELLQNLVQLFVVLGTLLWGLVLLAAPWTLLIAWLAWWLWAVNWRRTWAVLAEGAWAPVLLLMVLVAHVWASLAPSRLDVFGFVTVPNFWWQLGGVTLLAGLVLFCGWLQTILGWWPPEINLEPPPVGDVHAHHH